MSKSHKQRVPRRQPRRAGLRRCRQAVIESLETRALLSANGVMPPAHYAVGHDPLALALADFNNDAKPDLASANQSDDALSVRLNLGDGTFGPPTQWSVGDGPRALLAGDFNNDGNIDLAAANELSNTLSILLGQGNGSFNAPLTQAAGAAPWALAAADFNTDGNLDLAIANWDSDTLSILLGQGTGAFAAPTSYAVGTDPVALLAADFTADSKPDLAVANWSSNTLSLLINQGQGTFAPATPYSVGANPGDLAAADFTGDGQLDLAATNSSDGTVSLLPGQGNGTFAPATTLNSIPAAMAAVAADIDGDGDPDLLLAALSATDNLAVLLNQGQGTFEAPFLLSAGNSPADLAAADLNADGRLDVLTANSLSDNLSVFLAKHLALALSPLEAFEGIATGQQLLATFTDTQTNLTADDYNATIDWGDGTTSAGLITQLSPGNFEVRGEHTYLSSTATQIALTIADPYATEEYASAPLALTPAELFGLSAAVSANQGSAFSGPVGRFIDTNPFSTPGDFSATVRFTDGATNTTVPGTIQIDPLGGFNVVASHTYASAGTHPIQVSVFHEGALALVIDSSAEVAIAGLMGSGLTLTPTQGLAFTEVLATLADANPLSQADDFSVDVRFTDGTSQNTVPGTLQTQSPGVYLISAGHTFANVGTFPILLTVHRAGAEDLLITATAKVQDASLSATLLPIQAAQNVAFDAILATLIDQNPLASATDYLGTIAWGDGNNGALSFEPTATPGRFNVRASHTYAAGGTYTLSMNIQAADQGSVHLEGPLTVSAPPITATGITGKVVEGTRRSGLVATFQDAEAGHLADYYTAQITWPNQATTAGIIASDGAGGFRVLGTYTFRSVGANTIRVRITDNDGTVANATTTLTVANARLTLKGKSFTARAKKAYYGAVATLTDANPLAKAGEYRITLHWGDRKTSAAKAVLSPKGFFNILAKHAYAKPGKYKLTIVLTDAAGGKAKAYSTATVR